MKLALVGKGKPISLEQLAPYHQWWTVGTHPLAEKASTVFELHDIPIPFKALRAEDLAWIVKKYSFMPFNSSVDYMMAVAVDLHSMWGTLHIDILGCPMKTSIEYLEQRPSLGCWIGYAIAKGIMVSWPDGIKLGDRYMGVGDGNSND